MFKSARWKSEKNKIKIVFKLQFHAAQLTQLEADSLMISVVPADVGKPTVKSDKVAVRNGSCLWENPVYENVKFNRDPKSGKFVERIYYFVVGTGSSKAGVIGEASIDFSSYAEATKVALVSLPLKNSKTEAVLHVSIQRIHESVDQREVEEIENAKVIFKDHSLKSQLEYDMDGIVRSSSVEDLPLHKTDSHMNLLNGNRLVSSGSDVTLSSSDGVEIPWLHSEEASDIVIEKLRTENFALSRQAEMSEIELQTLRKQIVKESKRGNDLFKEVVCLKEEREKLKTDLQFGGGDSKAVVEELRQEINNGKELNLNLQIQLQKMQESNSELILAVQDLEEILEKKNQETQDMAPTYQTDDEVDQKALDEVVNEHSDSKDTYLLEQQIMDLRSEIEICKRDKDELEIQMEQLALDYEIIKQENHDMLYKMEQSQIQEQLKIQYECSPFYNERELESHIEKLERELERQTKESEDSLITITNLETHIKDLEVELEKQEEGFEADLEAITCSKVEQEKRAIMAEEKLRKTHWQNANTAERIQDEFRKISLQMMSTFEANEKLAAKALAEAKKLQFEKKHLEEMLQKTSDEVLALKDEIETYIAMNTNLEEQIGDKEIFKGELEKTRISIKEMELLLEQGNDERFEYDNKVVLVKNEAEDLHMKLNKLRCLLEEKESVVGRTDCEKEILKGELEKTRLSVMEMELLMEQGNDERIELEKKVMLVKIEAEDLHMELNKLRCLLEEKESIVGRTDSEKYILKEELEKMRLSVVEMKLLLEQGNVERIKLENKVMLVKNEAEDLHMDLHKLRCLLEEKESIVGRTNCEKETLKEELEKTKLLNLELELLLKQGNDELIELENKVMYVKNEDEVLQMELNKSKCLLEEKESIIGNLQGVIKLKDSELEMSSNAFLEKEKDLLNQMEELEGKLEVDNQSRSHITKDGIKQMQIAPTLVDEAPHCRFYEDTRNNNENISSRTRDVSSNENESTSLSTKSDCEGLPETQNDSMANSGDIDKLRNEMGIIKEMKKSTEEELKEMQEKYSEISLKFAEVENERQQLAIKVRYLKKAKKKAHNNPDS